MNRHSNALTVSSCVLFSTPGPTLPLTGITRPCSQLLFLLLYPNTRGEMGQSGEQGFAKEGSGEELLKYLFL